MYKTENGNYKRWMLKFYHKSFGDETFLFDTKENMLIFSKHEGVRVEKMFYLADAESVLSEQELYDKYGYLMDGEHGRDTELLMDIMKCNGIEAAKIGSEYLISI